MIGIEPLQIGVVTR